MEASRASMWYNLDGNSTHSFLVRYSEVKIPYGGKGKFSGSFGERVNDFNMAHDGRGTYIRRITLEVSCKNRVPYDRESERVSFSLR